jgi:hypothetical protein
VTHLSERDAIDYLCTDLVQRNTPDDSSQRSSSEETPLLNEELQPDDLQTDEPSDAESGTVAPKDYQQLNALEIAAVCEAKKFMSQRAVQRIIDGLWKGDIMLWQTMSRRTVKKATLYQPKRCDPFTRLRVPLYLKAFEVLFFAAFLAFYYTVLVQKSFHTVTSAEIMLYVWLAAFTYNGMFHGNLESQTGLMLSHRARRTLGCWLYILRRGFLGRMGSEHYRCRCRILYLTNGRPQYRQPHGHRYSFRHTCSRSPLAGSQVCSLRASRHDGFRSHLLTVS